MKTRPFAGIFRLVSILLLLTGVARGELYDAVLLKHNIGTTRPDPSNPFPTGGSNLYLDPSTITTDTEIYVSMEWGFLTRDTKEWVAVKRPDLAYAGFSMSGRYEQNGNVVTSGLGGSQNLQLTGAVYTEPDALNPNPTTGGAWIYGFDTCGCLVTPTGSPIKDPNGVPMNDGAYTVSSNPDFQVARFVIVGAHRKLSSGFVNGARNLRTLATNTGTTYNLFLAVSSSNIIHSALGPTEGCMSSIQYPMNYRNSLIYCGNERGPVTLGLTIEAPHILVVKNGRLSDFLIQRSGDLLNWQPGTTPTTIENLVNGDTRLTFPTGQTVPPTITHPLPDGEKCYYRLAR